jgi:hypothetical protein
LNNRLELQQGRCTECRGEDPAKFIMISTISGLINATLKQVKRGRKDIFSGIHTR